MSTIMSTDSETEEKKQQGKTIENAGANSSYPQKEGEEAVIPHAEPWKWEKFFPGGYSRKRMLRFKNPKTMYRFINIFAGSAILTFGYDQGVMALINANENYWNEVGINSPMTNDRNVAAEGGIVSVFYGGTIIGALIAGSLADHAGRLKAIVFGAMWASLGAVLETSAQDIAYICVARVVAGVGVGALDAVVPVWSAEVSSHSARGAFLAVEFIMNIAGVALAYWLEYLIYYTTSKESSVAWRVPFALQLVFLAFIGIGVNFFPESPRWLAKVGREDEARDVLQATREGDIEAELRDIQKAVRYEQDKEGENKYWSMMFPKTKYGKQLRHRATLAVWLQIMQEAVGIAIPTVYGDSIFQDAGFSETLSKMLAGFNYISYMMSVGVAVVALDRYGRRSTLVYGAAAMAIILLIAGLLDKEANKGGPKQKQYAGGVAALTFLYTATFGATWLTVPWLYPAEIFPLHARAKGGAWSTVGWSIGNGIVTMIVPFLFKSISYGTFLLFFGLNILVIPFVILFYPETAGRSLESMDIFFEHGQHWNVFMASHHIRDETEIDDYRWTKKFTEARQAELEGGEKGQGIEAKEAEKDARQSWKKRPLYTFKRKASNAGLM